VVKFVPMYSVLVQMIRDSDKYQTATPETRRVVDDWLNSSAVRAYYGKIMVPQLSLHQSFLLGVLNSPELQLRNPTEQEIVIQSINSGVYGLVLNQLESALEKILQGVPPVRPSREK